MASPFSGNGLEAPRRIKRLADGDVHVEITIGAEPSGKGDTPLRPRLPGIMRQKRLFLNETDRIIGRVARFAGARIFAIAD